VAIAGTHGKSTTSAMLGHTLVACGLDPTVLVGATCRSLSPEGEPATGFRLGAAETPAGPLAGEPGLLIAEACEYNRSFHRAAPDGRVDHERRGGSPRRVRVAGRGRAAFAGFARLLPA
jgi:UDP-N-acetylmuramate--alanine ligase